MAACVMHRDVDFTAYGRLSIVDCRLSVNVEEVQAFVDDQFQASAASAFFAGSNFVTYIVRRSG